MRSRGSVRRETKTRAGQEPAPLDSDLAGAIWNLADTARILATEIPGDQKFLVSLLLGEIRRILRRGDAAP